MSDRSEELVHRAVDVEGRCNGNQILLLYLELCPVCRNVDLPQDVTGCIQGDNKRLGGTVALGVGTLAVRHALQEIEDEARG